MSLSGFLREANADIVEHAVRFAQTMSPLADKGIDLHVLRNHLPLVLDVIATDLEQPQTRQQSITKSEGLAVAALGETAAQTHGRMRAQVGLSVAQVIAEYRVLRAVVMRLWTDAGGLGGTEAIADLIRFNEAIDQAIAESVAFHSSEVERWRTTLLGVIGHDLRAPLSTMQMATEMLALGGSGETLAMSTDLLRRGAERLTTLLDSLLEYNNAGLGKTMALTRREVDVARVCAAEIELLRCAYPSASIEFEAPGAAVGRCDENRIREAVSNLVANAVQYRTPGTPIRVACAEQGDHVTVAVVNDGESIPPEVMQTYFEPLRRRDTSERRGSRRNLGLGLFIVREIARAHGGDVAAKSENGTIAFVLRLPKDAA